MAVSTLIHRTFALDDGLSRPVDTVVTKQTNQPPDLQFDRLVVEACLCIRVDHKHGQYY